MGLVYKTIDLLHRAFNVSVNLQCDLATDLTPEKLNTAVADWRKFIFSCMAEAHKLREEIVAALAGKEPDTSTVLYADNIYGLLDCRQLASVSQDCYGLYIKEILWSSREAANTTYNICDKMKRNRRLTYAHDTLITFENNLRILRSHIDNLSKAIVDRD